MMYMYKMLLEKISKGRMLGMFNKLMIQIIVLLNISYFQLRKEKKQMQLMFYLMRNWKYWNMKMKRDKKEM